MTEASGEIFEGRLSFRYAGRLSKSSVESLGIKGVYQSRDLVLGNSVTEDWWQDL